MFWYIIHYFFTVFGPIFTSVFIFFLNQIKFTLVFPVLQSVTYSTFFLIFNIFLSCLISVASFMQNDRVQLRWIFFPFGLRLAAIFCCLIFITEELFFTTIYDFFLILEIHSLHKLASVKCIVGFLLYSLRFVLHNLGILGVYVKNTGR